jgi:hypothetical protein
MAAVIHAGGLRDRINARRGPDAPAARTPGDAIAGMSLQGRGCANRPWSVTPPCCANTPRDLWCQEGLHASMGHRVTRGRTLAEASTAGGDRGCQAGAQGVWAPDGLDRRCTPLDTTSVARSGASVPARDAPAMTLTAGDAHEHRPAVKPAVLARRGSHEGGVPCGSTSGEGPPSDSAVVQARARALRAACQPAPSPRSRRADATLAPEDQAPTRPHLGVITRMPQTRGPVSQVIAPALLGDPWPRLEDNPRAQGRA